MMVEGVDYSTARPSPAGLWRAGKRFAARYLYGTTAGKAITRSEADALHAAGLAVVLIWEWQADEAKGGYSAGRDRACRAKAAVAALRAPANTAVYFAVDYDETNLARARDYFRGIVSVWPKERTGIYGGRRVIQAAKDGGWCPWLWQTYAWSGGRWVSGAHIQQYRNGVTVAGGDVDLCRATSGEFGQWRAEAEGDDVSAQDVWAWDPNRHVDGAVRNRPWRADAKRNVTVQPRYAVEDMWDRIRAIQVEQAAARLRDEAILAAVKGLDSATILARIGEVADQTVGLADLVRAGQSGELAAEDVVRLIGERLTAGPQ